LLLAGPDGLHDERTGERGRHRPGDEPTGQLEVRRSLPPVHRGTDALVDGGGDEVVGDGCGRVDAEEDQRRCHECTAAHPGQPYDDADQERDDEDAERPAGDDFGHV